MIDFIYSNPVIQAVRDTGTTVLVRHADCKSETNAGSYEFNKSKGIDEMIICPNNHTNYSDLADTIRHEAWHVVQACYGGALQPGKSEAFLDAETAKHIRDTYPKSHLDKEFEAWAVAERASEPWIVKLIKRHCN